MDFVNDPTAMTVDDVTPSRCLHATDARTWKVRGKLRAAGNTSTMGGVALNRRKRVGPVGLEPTTNGLKVRCSTN